MIMTKTPILHYAGPVRTKRMRILPGWAACCSGEKAEKIRALGHNTMLPGAVTCQACLKIMGRQI